jgi:hypothetical protein
MEEEQIREALNAHWRASAACDTNVEHDIALTMPFATIRSQASEFSGEVTCRPCEVIIPKSSSRKAVLSLRVINHLHDRLCAERRVIGIAADEFFDSMV